MKYKELKDENKALKTIIKNLVYKSADGGVYNMWLDHLDLRYQVPAEVQKLLEQTLED